MRQWVCLILLFFSLGACREPEKKTEIVRPVRAMQVQKPVTRLTHVFPGRTQAAERTNLSFRVSGPLVQLPVDVGFVADKGDLLAEIDPTDFAVQLESAEGKLERVRADLRFAKSDYTRALAVREQDPGAISAITVDQKEEALNRLLGEEKSVEAELRAAHDALRYTALLAPYSGIIVARFIENFEYVNAKEPVLRMLSSEQTEMTVDLPGSLLSHLGHLQEILVFFEGYPDRLFPAKIKELGVEASATTRTYPATLLVENLDQSILLAGMAGEARFLFDVPPTSPQAGFEVAAEAVFTDPELNRCFVWVVDPEKQVLEKRAVRVGRMTSRGLLITKGIEPGQWVVSAGVHSVHEGQKVKLLAVVLDATGRQLEQWAEE